MEKIPPKERFNQNAHGVSISDDFLLEILSEFGVNPAAFELKPLSGGFMNANFLASGADRQLVLRISASELPVAQMEFDLLRFLETHHVSTPKVFAQFEVRGRPVVVMEYLDGMTLEDRLLEGRPLDLDIFEAIGKELAAIHSIGA